MHVEHQVLPNAAEKLSFWLSLLFSLFVIMHITKILHVNQNLN